MHENPNLIIVGATAFDDKIFYNGIHRRDIGGACMYSSIPASVFYPVGVLTKVGYDFPINEIKKFNLDLTGLTVIKDEKTTIFYSKFLSKDGKQREITGDLSPKMKLSFDDIPSSYLKATHFHITTMEPADALKLVKKLRQNTSAKISVDTIAILANNPLTKQLFDLADIAFIDKEFTNLINCRAPIKIIKLGKEGCEYQDELQQFKIHTKTKQTVIDKAGAGDCMNGVFINLLANGIDPQKALQIACHIATISIDDYGILTLPDRISSEQNQYPYPLAQTN